ncbi:MULTISPECIES: alpha/beta fold hydrolase [Microbacterium]|jgi:haloacetate dehalogenase|uniref:alpha/beta fold hydrolase n=1 Tax=Microbacterium TaxID=33882 RepID=UPI001D1767E4|nr:alpha/beta hydrolase [Microbacterium testaceum]MCC4249764.1 alpha/beta hydrolase [Microbacterium testaceum]
MFRDFIDETVVVGECALRVRRAGHGPAVLLLHGHPRTGSTWHRVAPELVDAGFSVVVPDLPGYGRSTAPAPTDDHAAHSKRAAAGVLAALMSALGHHRYAVVGHDRGSYVAFRLALDNWERVERLVLMDCIPISEHLRRADARFAMRWWHWFFYAQPGLPERVINADPDAWYSGDPAVMGGENHAEWRAAIHDPGVVRAMLEDYRAGLTIDRKHEEADRRAGRRLTMPLLCLWSLRDDLEDLYGDPLVIWRDWADDLQGVGIDSGHHIAEEEPRALVAALTPFLAQDPSEGE